LNRYCFSGYLLAFYAHGKYQLLRNEKVPFSSIYDKLYTFNMTIRSINVALKKSNTKSARLLFIFDEIQSEFQRKFDKIRY
jgi:hypothetical protein